MFNSFSWVKSQIIQLRKGDKKIFIYKIKKFFFIILIFISTIIILPFFLIIRLISNFFLIRFGKIPSRRIGHFIIDTNLYIYNLRKNPKNSIDLFCLEKPVCNKALLKIFKKYLITVPDIIMLPLLYLNKIKYLGHNKHNIILNPYYSGHDLRTGKEADEKINYFNKNDNEIGNSFLRKLGLKETDKFVCFLCRDEEYYKYLFNKTYDKDFYFSGDQSKFRNTKIENFRSACEYLTDNGYYIFRMGQKVSEPFSINNEKFIDYATLGIRTEFLDIFLAANCEFFLSTGSGLDSVSRIFNKPRVRVSNSRISLVDTTCKRDLYMPRHHFHKSTNKELTLTELFDTGLATASKDLEFQEKKVITKDNSPEEIKNAVIEMIDLIKNNFEVDEERRIIENKFWKNFLNKMNDHGLQRLLNGNKFYSHVSINFLKENDEFMR
tara:strand:- start:7350 stop:8660 length:1311 start_codon:yes stop_codon:yes gene_type:complete